MFLKKGLVIHQKILIIISIFILVNFKSIHLENVIVDKYWSEKPRPASSLGPSRRHYSLVNQTYASPGEVYNKENIPQYSNRNYRRYLGDFERLDENPSDEERYFIFLRTYL